MNVPANPSGRQSTESHRRDALDDLLPAVYDDLRNIASRHLARRDAPETLSPTGLVHEAYLKLVEHSRLHWRDRAHFLALVSVAMRHVLVDRAKARLAEKRSGNHHAITLDETGVAVPVQPETLLELDEAVAQLARVEPRLAQVVECRFFGGLTEEETADALGVAPRTVQRDWMKARMLLRRVLAR